MKTLLAAGFLIGFASSAAAEQKQFDLKCTGTAKTETQKVDGPFQRTIHVDLASGQYCNDECTSVRRIASVDPLRIAFEWGEASAFSMNRVTVDRRTGEYVIGQLNVEPNKWIVGSATCSPAPFTPFPATRF
ncbi:MAG: hypothetical protein ACM3ZV_02050 [Bacillota bacterium]